MPSGTHLNTQKTGTPTSDKHNRVQVLEAAEHENAELEAIRDAFTTGHGLAVPAPPPPNALSPSTILRMQKLVGNQAVMRMMQPTHTTPVQHSTRQETQQQDMGEEEEVIQDDFLDDTPGHELGGGNGDDTIMRSPDTPVENTIQRISLDDLDPSAVIDRISSILSIGDGAEEEAESNADTQAESTKEQAETQAQTLETNAQETTEQSAELQQEADQEKTQVETQATEGQSQVDQAQAQGLSQLQSAGAAVRPALSLANQVTNPGAASAAGAQIGGLGQPLAADPETVSAVGESIGNAVDEGLAADGQEGWNCDEAEVLGIATGLGREALDGLITAADELTDGGASRLIEFAEEIGSKLQQEAEQVLQSVRELGSAISSQIEELTQPLVDAVNSGMETVRETYNRAKEFVTEQWESLKTSFVEGWNSLKDSATEWVNQQIASARETIQSAINRASEIINSVGSTIRDMLPDWLVSGIDDLRDTLSGVQDTIREGIDDAVEWAGEVKDEALEAGEQLADEALQEATEAYREAGEFKDQLIEGIQDAGRAAVEAIPEPIREAANDAADYVGEQVDAVRDAAGEVLEEVGGAVCKPLSDIAEPCLDRYLPFDESTSSSVSLNSSQSVTVPLHEIGIPANAEIGEGAALTLSRTGPSTYTLQVSGDSSIMLTEEQTNPNLSVGVDLPSGQNAKGAEIWRQLTTGASQAADAGGGGGGSDAKAGVKAKAGTKRTVSVTYTFNTDGTCDLASLAGVLAGYGASSALAAVAPPPFSEMISGGGAAATAVAFNSYITNISMQNANVASVSGGVGGLDGSAGVQSSQTMALERNDEGELIPSMTYAVQISGSLAGKLNLSGVMSAGASLGAQGSLSLKLNYNDGNITPEKLVAAVEATLAMNGFSTSSLPLDHIPADAPDTINQKLEMLRNLGVNGNIKASLKYTVPLEGIVNALRNYFDTAPIESITWSGVIDIVSEQFAANPPTSEFKVTLTETERVGVSVSGGVSAEGAAIGFSGSASASHNIVHQLYPPAGGSTVVPDVEHPDTDTDTDGPDNDLEPEHPEVEPGHPEPGGGGGGGGHSGPPEHKNPLDMTVEEFELSEEGQNELFEMAHSARDSQQSIGDGILTENQIPGTVKSILKRSDFEGFVAGIIEKCKRKNYPRIGDMPDIVRGRFNTDKGPDVERIVAALLERYPNASVTAPRRPNEEGFGYPRWHVVVQEESGILHEWQIGTQAVTDVYETEGIEIPDEVGELPPDMNADIHDIEYDVLQQLNKEHPDIGADVGIPEFSKAVDLLSARAGRLGNETPDLQENIAELHAQCSQILQDICDRHGPEYIRKYIDRKHGEGEETDAL